MAKTTNPVDPIFFKLFADEKAKWGLKKVQILSATIDCLSELGVENTTFDQVARRVGIARSHVIYYYPEWEELIGAAIQFISVSAQEVTVERVKAATSPEDAIRAVILAAFEWAERYPGHARVMLLFYYYASFKPHYQKLNHEVRETGHQRLTQLLSSLPEASRRKPAELRQLAKSIQQLITGYLLESLTIPQANWDARKAATEKTCMDLIRQTLKSRAQ